MSEQNENGGASGTDAKLKDLGPNIRTSGEHLTTNQGLRISDDNNSLKAGARGPTLLEDFHFREKMTHFDHERIPERVVHARGAGAHGYFQVYESQAEYTMAKFLQDPSKKIPVFVRFSTVAGSRGSADTPRDVRGFATKFYTEEGVWDLVGNNIPVFFIQDAIKFPDFVHSVKPEPPNEIPQAASAHATFWDFAALTPEITHMLMWVMSDRALPRSFSMMEGFGVHTFRLINAQGKARFVKFHWKPLLGVHSLVWDEAQKLAGKDPDFNRRDLWDSIELGNYPEWELGFQIIEEADEFKFDFDLLDPTKVVPEELVPVRRVGRMTLNRNPDNFFAETEQAAFHPGHVVPGIDFTNDPLLQGRLFSYIDTQLRRVGPNFAELPINRPTCPVHNNQRDAMGRVTIDKGRAAYFPNTLGGGCPMHSPGALAAFTSYAEKVEGHKIRERSKSFGDHFSQATLFWNSMSDWEKRHIVDAFSFELNMVDVKEVRERVVRELLSNVSDELARKVATNLGLELPSGKKPASWHDKTSPALSMANTVKNGIKARKVAILASEGVNGDQVTRVQAKLKAAGALGEVVSRFGGMVMGADGRQIPVDKTSATAASVFYDGVFVPGGRESVTALKRLGPAVHFLNEAYSHGKAIGAVGEGLELLSAANFGPVELASGDGRGGVATSHGVVTATAEADLDSFVDRFIDAIGQNRHFDRPIESVPA